jgi:hypothetical protein
LGNSLAGGVIEVNETAYRREFGDIDVLDGVVCDDYSCRCESSTACEVTLACGLPDRWHR